MEAIQNLSLSEKIQLHIYRTKPVLNLQALFTDGSMNYVQPMEPNPVETVTIRFRTARDNVEHVYICLNGEQREMQVSTRTDQFDFYQISF